MQRNHLYYQMSLHLDPKIESGLAAALNHFVLNGLNRERTTSHFLYEPGRHFYHFK